jgi:hypothetical protein
MKKKTIGKAILVLMYCAFIVSCFYTTYRLVGLTGMLLSLAGTVFLTAVAALAIWLIRSDS